MHVVLETRKARWPFFVLADIAASARRKTAGKAAAPISPLALEAVRRIDQLFEIKRTINGSVTGSGKLM